MRRLLRFVRLPFLAALFVGACSGNSKGTSQFYVASGTCQGTPMSCAGLSGADCANVAGCQDTGACTGTATGIGTSCGAQTTFASCSVTTGCFWQASCSGAPFGTCSGVTETQCTSVPGCFWTPYFGTGGNQPDARR